MPINNLYFEEDLYELKGIIHPKMRILSFITHPHVVPKPVKLIQFRSSFNHNVTKPREYFCAKKTKIMTYDNKQFYLFCVSLRRAFTIVPQARMCLLLLVNKAQRIRVLRQNAGSCVSSTIPMYHDTLINLQLRLTWKRRNCWIKLSFLLYFNDVLTTFLGLERISCVAVYAGSESSWFSSKIS